MANNYSELLKDPRWQKKRREIFERDDLEEENKNLNKLLRDCEECR